MKAISVEGFGRVEPSTGFALAVFGPDGAGKTRLIAQAQQEAYMDDKETGVIVLDRKTRNTLKMECNRLQVPMPLTNKREYVTAQDAMRLVAMPDGTDKEREAAMKAVKEFYTGVVARIFADCVKLGDHKDILTISIDPCTELYDYMFYAHFGRKNQIPQISRAAVNQDLIDLIKAISHKNLILTHRESPEYVDKGKREGANNTVVKEDSGRKKLQGYKDIGYQVDAIIQLKSDDKKRAPDKFTCDVIKAPMAVHLEGEKSWLEGTDIQWSAIKEGLWAPEEE